MQLDLERVRKNVRSATTEDLLDRVTVYRAGMEPSALAIIEHELDQRGVTLDQIAEHEAMRRERMIELPDGTAMRCSFCERPAVAQGWGWHRIWGRIPVFPRRYAYCEVHEPRPTIPAQEGEGSEA